MPVVPKTLTVAIVALCLATRASAEQPVSPQNMFFQARASGGEGSRTLWSPSLFATVAGRNRRSYDQRFFVCRRISWLVVSARSSWTGSAAASPWGVEMSR
jgi:hypothetical protein